MRSQLIIIYIMTRNQLRFIRTLTATWKVLRDPVLTTIYMKKWKNRKDKTLTIYGYVFQEMYKAAWRHNERQAMCYSGREMVATQMADFSHTKIAVY